LVQNDDNIEAVEKVLVRQPDLLHSLDEGTAALDKAQKSNSNRISCYLRALQNPVVLFHALVEHDVARDAVKKMAAANPDLIESVHEGKSPLGRAMSKNANEVLWAWGVNSMIRGQC
jgi:ABC-type iron transport system FetAB ATPase subunit